MSEFASGGNVDSTTTGKRISGLRGEVFWVLSLLAIPAIPFIAVGTAALVK